MLSPQGGNIESVLKNVKQRRKSLDSDFILRLIQESNLGHVVERQMGDLLG